MAQPLEQIAGSVETITFRNEETGYTVLSIQPIAERQGDQRRVTVVGKCATVWVGEELTATGCWIEDPRFGRQFKAESIICVAPTSVEGIRRFLSSGLIRGIGPVLAEAIVKRFGTDTIHILDSRPDRLREVPKVGRKKCEMIRKSWSDQRQSHETMIFLQAQGIGTGTAARIWRRYGSDAIAIVKRNPYRLAEDVRGIGFLTADQIALRMGIAKDSELRAEAGLKIPVVGSSDVHGMQGGGTFPYHFTICFAEANENDAIIEAVRSGRSVAVDAFGEDYARQNRCYGSLRLVSYAQFLLQRYFPARQRVCQGEGVAMRAYAIGEADKTLIEAQAAASDAFRKRFFGELPPVLPTEEMLEFEERRRAIHLAGPTTKGSLAFMDTVTRQI